jgi:two-component system, NarL family, nitrate/nitrite response regulator NarL
MRRKSRRVVIKKTVLIATDEPILAVGVRTLFAQDPDFQLLEICPSVSELIAAASKYRPDAIVYGLGLERSLNIIRDLLTVAPHSALICWSRSMGTEVAHQAVNLGVKGFVSTTASPEHFRECLQITSRGELWMEQSLTMSLLGTQPVKLSKRQGELLGLLVQGLKNKEIAATLGLSEGTIKAYLTTLFEKVGARDRFELALFGLKHLGETRVAAPTVPRHEEAPRDTQIRSMISMHRSEHES